MEIVDLSRLEAMKLSIRRVLLNRGPMKRRVLQGRTRHPEIPNDYFNLAMIQLEDAGIIEVQNKDVALLDTTHVPSASERRLLMLRSRYADLFAAKDA